MDGKGWAKGRRRTHLYYVYDGDGRFFKEHLSSDAKRYWRRWTRRMKNEEAKDAVNEWNDGETEATGELGSAVYEDSRITKNSIRHGN